MTIHDLKIIIACFVFVGIVIGFINQKKAPNYLALVSSPDRPKWLPWLSWGLTSVAAILYIVLDFIE